MGIRRSVIAALREAADPVRAPQQQAYMKSEMPFLGVTVPECRRIAGSVFKVHPLPDAPAWEAAILDLWRNAAHREERYAAIELLLFKRYSCWIEPARVPMVEELVVTGAWWDYVDAIAGRGMGTMLAAHPRPVKSLLRKWAKDDNFWKRRTAILAQLRARGATDRKPAGRRDRAVHRQSGVLPSQGHRLGLARVLEDRSGLGGRIRRDACRAFPPESAGSPETPGTHEALMSARVRPAGVGIRVRIGRMDSRLRGNNGKGAVDVIPAKAGIHGFSDQRSSKTRKPNTDAGVGGRSLASRSACRG